MGEIVTVNFRGDELYGFRQADGVFLALKPMVEAMGLDWSGQLQRLRRDPILSEGVGVMPTPFGRHGGQEAVCLKVDLIQGWLFTIDTLRIKDEDVRKKVQLYQRECYTVLHAHFTGKSVATDQLEGDPDTTPTFAERLRAVTEARQTFDTMAARQMWMKMHLPVVPAMLEPPPWQPPLFSYEAVKRGGDQAA